jgi:CheY-like chemotaxis protein
MPVMDGYESVRRFREFEKEHLGGNALMVVGMSAKADEITVREALASGMDLFVTKPFRYETLVDILVSSRLMGELGEGRYEQRQTYVGTGQATGPASPLTRVTQTYEVGIDVDVDAVAGGGRATVLAVVAAASPGVQEEDDLVRTEAKKKPTGRLPPIK